MKLAVTLTLPFGGDAADIVAPEIEQHQVLGAFLGIGEQAFLVGGVLVLGLAARAGAGDRADRHFAVAHADEDLGARADHREARQVEEIEERRGVHPPQRAVEVERRQREGAGEALGEHDLEDVARLDVVLRLEHHASRTRPSGITGSSAISGRSASLQRCRDRPGELPQGFVDPLAARPRSRGRDRRRRPRAGRCRTVRR